jgi:hypothetical protein
VSRHFDDLDAVLEFDALDDFGQLIFALQSSPRFRSGVDQFEHHELGGLRRQGSFRAHRSMPHRREHALDRIRCPQMIPVLGGEVEEGELPDPSSGRRPPSRT